MKFKPVYAKAERQTGRTKQPRFARCNVSFWVRGKGSMLMVRVICKGAAQANRSVGVKVKSGQFDSKTLQLAGQPAITARLIDLKASILKVFTEREMTGRSLEPKVILDITFGLRGHDDLIPSINEVLDRFLEQKKQLMGDDLTRNSLKQYHRYRNIINEFTTIYYGKDAKLDVLKPAVHYELMGYIKGERKSGHNYAVKVIQFLKSVLTYAVAHEWCDRNVLQATRFTKHKKEVKTLEMADLVKLQQTDFAEDNLNEVRDVFLFCVFTGLAYADVKSLTPGHIVVFEGVQCVLKDRQKSGQQSFVPLFPEAIALLNKYQRHRICRINGVCLPVLSNVKMNKWLKVIGNVAKIKEALHTHLARKTFTMYAEERGFDLKATSIMMGHAHSYMTEQFYYKQRRETVIKAFKDIQRNESQDHKRQAS